MFTRAVAAGPVGLGLVTLFPHAMGGELARRPSTGATFTLELAGS